MSSHDFADIMIFRFRFRSDATSSLTQIPLFCMVMNLKITCSNACRNVGILSIKITFSLKKLGKLVDFINGVKMIGISGTLSFLAQK